MSVVGAIVASQSTRRGARRELGAGKGEPVPPRAPGVVGDQGRQLPVLALGQPSRWVELAPGLRPEGGARARASRPVSAWLSAEVSWRREPRARCCHSVPYSKASFPFLPWR